MILNENPKPLDQPGGGGGSAAAATINFYSDSGYTILITDFDYRDTVYIEVATTGAFVPVTYTLTVNNQANTEIEIQKNGTGQFTYQALFAGTITFRGEAENGASETIGETIDIDVDDLSDDTFAAEFIYQHNVATGLTMAAVQRTAITTLSKNLNGDGTFNSSQFLPRMIEQGSKFYPYCPVDNSTANNNAYKMNLIDPSDNLTFVNFVAGDFTPQGLIGGATKKASTGLSTNRFLTYQIGHHVYCRTNSTADLCIMGDSYASLQLWLRTPALNSHVALNSAGANIAVADSLGLASISQIFGEGIKLRKRGVVIGTLSAGGTVSSNEIFLHCAGSTYFDTRQAAGFCLGFTPLTANEWADWEELWTRYQTNVITGGRQV
jgi:hypothetical protein